MLIYVLDRDYANLKEADSIFNKLYKDSAKCFADGKMLIEAIQEKEPNYVIMEAKMSCSKQVADYLTKNTKRTKIIVMSNCQESAVIAFEIGAIGFILKPLSEDNIKKQLFRITHPILSMFSAEK